jgi:hypothetical protein
MSIFDELSSATGNKQSNLEMVERCLTNPYLLHTLAEGLRTGKPSARVDCARVMIAVAKRRPDLVGNFVGDFLDATRQSQKNIARLGFNGLSTLLPVAANEIFAAREEFIERAKKATPLSLPAVDLLAELCAHSANYRGKLLVPLTRLLRNVAADQLSKWLKTLAPAFAGSREAVQRLELELASVLPGLSPEHLAAVEEQLTRLKKSSR